MSLRDPKLHATAWAVLVAAALLVTGPEMGPAGPWIRWLEAAGADTVIHLALFLVQSLLLVRVFPRPRTSRHLVLAGVVAAAYGALTEAAQLIHPERSAELGDLAADAIGSALGAVLARRLR